MLLISASGGLPFGGLALRGKSLAGYGVASAIVFLSVGFFEEYLLRGCAQFTLTAAMAFGPRQSYFLLFLVSFTLAASEKTGGRGAAR